MAVISRLLQPARLRQEYEQQYYLDKASSVGGTYLTPSKAQGEIFHFC